MPQNNFSASTALYPANCNKYALWKRPEPDGSVSGDRSPHSSRTPGTNPVVPEPDRSSFQWLRKDRLWHRIPTRCSRNGILCLRRKQLPPGNHSTRYTTQHFRRDSDRPNNRPLPPSGSFLHFPAPELFRSVQRTHRLPLNIRKALRSPPPSLWRSLHTRQNRIRRSWLRVAGKGSLPPWDLFPRRSVWQ